MFDIPLGNQLYTVECDDEGTPLRIACRGIFELTDIQQLGGFDPWLLNQLKHLTREKMIKTGKLLWAETPQGEWITVDARSFQDHKFKIAGNRLFRQNSPEPLAEGSIELCKTTAQNLNQ